MPLHKLPRSSYMTYFTESNRCADFAQAGCKLYTFPLFFASKTINETSQCPIFAQGMFDGGTPDFSLLDREAARILDACPDAMIFPRVNVSLPQWWEDANPDELNDTGTAKFPDSRRPCFSSDKWADEVKRLLTLTVEHIEASSYRDSIVGYQIAGGNTEEWFSYDMKGSVGLRSREKYAELVNNGTYDGSEYGYYRFLSEITARRICEFASHVKRLTDHRLAVGTFYGYTYECPFRESVHHALKTVLECPDIDFICSPVSYAHVRKAGYDHAYMLPLDSLKLHGKLYFSENDTRTHLTKPLCDLPHYNVPIWFGQDADTTCEIMKMHFARALVNCHNYWWFDMWGGWYGDARYMSLIRRFGEILDADDGNAADVTEAAFFADEAAYAAITPDNAAVGRICYNVREQLGKMGLPYAKYLASDFDAVHKRYKAVILAEPVPTPASEHIKQTCKEKGIPCLTITPEDRHTPDSLRSFCRDAGCRVVCERDAVVYLSGRYVFVHAPEDGEYVLDVGGGLVDLFDGQTYGSKLMLRTGESRVFEVVH